MSLAQFQFLLFQLCSHWLDLFMMCSHWSEQVRVACQDGRADQVAHAQCQFSHLDLDIARLDLFEFYYYLWM